MSTPKNVLTWISTIAASNDPFGPNELAAIALLVEQFVNVDKQARAAILKNVNAKAAEALRRYTHRSAEESVRHRDPNQIVAGVTALAIGSRHIDPRDVVVALSLLAHSAVKLGRVSDEILESTLTFVPDSFGDQIRDFLERDEEDRAIKEMGFKEGKSKDGFHYVPISPSDYS